MKLLYSLIAAFYLLATPSILACEKCTTEKVITVQENMTQLNFKIVEEFLCTFDESCKDDLEYTRMANETLFDLVYNAPELFLKVLQFGGLKNHDLIMSELKRPVHAGIDTQVIHSKIKSQDDKYMFKYDVLSALK